MPDMRVNLRAWVVAPRLLEADDASGHWVTVGGKDAEGKGHGGAHIFITDAGTITKGPPALLGVTLPQPGDAAAPTKHPTFPPGSAGEDALNRLNEEAYQPGTGKALLRQARELVYAGIIPNRQVAGDYIDTRNFLYRSLERKAITAEQHDLLMRQLSGAATVPLTRSSLDVINAGLQDAENTTYKHRNMMAYLPVLADQHKAGETTDAQFATLKAAIEGGHTLVNSHLDFWLTVFAAQELARREAKALYLINGADFQAWEAGINAKLADPTLSPMALATLNTAIRSHTFLLRQQAALPKALAQVSPLFPDSPLGKILAERLLEAVGRGQPMNVYNRISLARTAIRDLLLGQIDRKHTKSLVDLISGEYGENANKVGAWRVTKLRSGAQKRRAHYTGIKGSLLQAQQIQQRQLAKAPNSLTGTFRLKQDMDPSVQGYIADSDRIGRAMTAAGWDIPDDTKRLLVADGVNIEMYGETRDVVEPQSIGEPNPSTGSTTFITAAYYADALRRVCVFKDQWGKEFDRGTVRHELGHAMDQALARAREIPQDWSMLHCPIKNGKEESAFYGVSSLPDFLKIYKLYKDTTALSSYMRSSTFEMFAEAHNMMHDRESVSVARGTLLMECPLLWDYMLARDKEVADYVQSVKKEAANANPP